MKKTRIILMICTFLLAPVMASAQKTTVSATIVDPNGLPYTNSTVSIALVPPGGSPATVGGAPIGGFVQTGTDGNGFFSVDLFCNTAGGACGTPISPANTKWQFTICNPGVQPPLGTGNQCFTPAAITITGTTQDVSTQMNAVAAAIAKGGLTQIKNVSLTSAQIKAVKATPVTLVTPSASQRVIPILCVVRYTAGATPYTLGGASDFLAFGTSAEIAINQGTPISIFAQGLLDSATSKDAIAGSVNFAPGTATLLTGQAFLVSKNTDTGEFTLGDGTIQITVYYFLL